VITGIRRVSLDVSDMAKALVFFIEQMDLPLLREIGSREHTNRWEMGFSVSGTTIAIEQKRSTQYPTKPGRVTVAFETDDIEEDYQALVARGIVFTSPPTPDPFEGTMACFEGPDGVMLSLVELKDP